MASARWFVAHEAAHFWLGQGVSAPDPAEAWITEGGAQVMATRALGDLDPAFDMRARLQTEVDACVDGAREPVATAADRGALPVFYACGAVFHMAAEAAQARADGGDLFGFLRPLVESRRASGVIGRADWLRAFNRVAGPFPGATIAGLLDRGSDDPARDVSALFALTGVAHRREGDRVVLE